MSPEAANLEALGLRFPGLARILAGTEPLPLEDLATPSGAPSARAGGALLHSSYAPAAEAARLAAGLEPPWADCVVVLGPGLWYAVEAALALRGVERVVACEAEPALFRAALRRRDLRGVLSDERLSIVAGGRPEGILAALDAVGARTVALLRNTAASALSPDWYARCAEACGRFRAKEEINANTLRKFGRLWTRNLARNLGATAACPGIAPLRGRFAGFPALVAAAGPSLDGILPRIRELRERALVVAVDTSLRSLLRAGVEPDFLAVVDPQYWNWRHVADLAAPRSYLVTEPAVFPPVFRLPCRGSFVAESAFPLGRFLDREGPPRGALGAGGSVATSAWDLARQLGAARVWLAGLDLGYPGGRTHARASLFEQRALAASSRLAPAATAQAAALLGPGSLLAPAAGGGSVLTDRRMTLYAWWFESRLARPDSPPSARPAPGGLEIPGLGLSSLEELLALPPRRGELDAILAELEPLAGRPGTGPSSLPRPRALDELIEGLRGVAATAGRGRAAAAAARDALASGRDPGHLLRVLDEVDASLSSSASREVAGFLLPSLGELLGGRARDLAQSLEQSEALYAGLAESTGYGLATLEAAAADFP